MKKILSLKDYMAIKQKHKTKDSFNHLRAIKLIVSNF